MKTIKKYWAIIAGVILAIIAAIIKEEIQETKTEIEELQTAKEELQVEEKPVEEAKQNILNKTRRGRKSRK